MTDTLMDPLNPPLADPSEEVGVSSSALAGGLSSADAASPEPDPAGGNAAPIFAGDVVRPSLGDSTDLPADSPTLVAADGSRDPVGVDGCVSNGAPVLPGTQLESVSSSTVDNMGVDNPPAVKTSKRGRPKGGKIPRKQTADGIPALLRREAGQYRVRLSMLPRAVAKVRQHTNGLRDGIESACVVRHGGVSLSQALVIQSVCRTEENIRVLERLLKDGWDDLSVKDRADLLDRISRLSEKRDNHLAKLNLDNDHTAKADPFAVLDVTTTPVEGMPNE